MHAYSSVHILSSHAAFAYAVNLKGRTMDNVCLLSARLLPTLGSCISLVSCCCRLQDHQCGALLGPRDRCAAVRAGTVLDRHTQMFERLGCTHLHASSRAAGALAALLHLPRLPAISVCTHAFSAFSHWPPQAWQLAPTWRSSRRSITPLFWSPSFPPLNAAPVDLLPQAWLWAPTWRSSCRPTSITTTMPQVRLSK